MGKIIKSESIILDFIWIYFKNILIFHLLSFFLCLKKFKTLSLEKRSRRKIKIIYINIYQ